MGTANIEIHGHIALVNDKTTLPHMKRRGAEHG